MARSPVPVATSTMGLHVPRRAEDGCVGGWRTSVYNPSSADGSLFPLLCNAVLFPVHPATVHAIRNDDTRCVPGEGSEARRVG